MTTPGYQIKLLQEQLDRSRTAMAGILAEYDKVRRELAAAKTEIEQLKAKKKPQLKQKCDPYKQMELYYEDSAQRLGVGE